MASWFLVLRGNGRHQTQPRFHGFNMWCMCYVLGTNRDYERLVLTSSWKFAEQGVMTKGHSLSNVVVVRNTGGRSGEESDGTRRKINRGVANNPNVNNVKGPRDVFNLRSQIRIGIMADQGVSRSSSVGVEVCRGPGNNRADQAMTAWNEVVSGQVNEGKEP